MVKNSGKRKIQGYLGERDERIALVCYKTGKKESWIAVERYTMPKSTSDCFLATPYNPKKIKRWPEDLIDWLNAKRREIGGWTDAETYNNATAYTGGKPQRKATPRTSPTGQYSQAIGGDLHKKTMAQVRAIIRRAESAEQEFIKQLQF